MVTKIETEHHLQETGYSCGSACLQMICSYYGLNISHKRAIQLTKAEPDGCTQHAILRALNKIFNKVYGNRFKMKKVRNPTKYIMKGLLVLATASVHEEQDHWIMLRGVKSVCGRDEEYLVSDPLQHETYWRRCSSVIKDSVSEFFVFQLKRGG